MAKRRDQGLGTIYKDGNRWAGQIDLGRGADGKRRRRKIRGRTQAEVRERMREALKNLESGVHADPRLTVADFLRRWFADRPADSLGEKTKASYRLAIEGHIIPSIGHVRLKDLAPADVRKMLSDLEDRRLGTSTRRTARAVLRRALRTAEQDRLVANNAAAIADAPPTTPAKTDDTLTPAEIRRILDGSKDDRLHALAVVLLMLGLRSGEARALRWEDIDLEAGTLTVSGTLTENPGQGLQRAEKPKTKESARTIPLPERARLALKAHKKRQAEEALASEVWDNPNGYVFTSTVGTPINNRNALRWWKGLLTGIKPDENGAKIEPRRIHAARHSAASFLLDEGVPLELVSRILGHSSIRVTADIYSRITQDAMRRGLSAFDRLDEATP